MFDLKNSQKIKIIFLFLGVFLFGVFVGLNNKKDIDQVNNLSNKETPISIQADFSPFWKAWNELNEKYPNAEKITNQQKVYGAIAGLTNSFDDPYTMFFNPEETKIFQDDIEGTFGGVGMEVGIKDKIITVIAPLKDTPAYKAGIKSGDKILKINDTITSDLTIDEAVKLIRGEKGTTVSLSLYREGDKEPREIKVVRDIINVPTLDTELRSDGIFVIKLYSFTANSHNLFRKALQEFVDSKSSKLVLDLRGNPGGYLESAVDMVSWFLPKGKAIVYEDYGKNKKEDVHRSKGYDIFNKNLKFIILIDGGSASASEIVAGAMQDYGIAKLVGTQSYGKGSVQEVLDLTPDTILKVTIAKWLTPNKNSISEKGLTPDYKVEFTKKDVEKKNDPQMNKAVELLLEPSN